MLPNPLINLHLGTGTLLNTFHHWMLYHTQSNVLHALFQASITSVRRCDREIKRRIAMSRETFSKLKTILCIPEITEPTRLKVLECCVLPILKYGCETWTVSKEMERRIDAAEKWFLRRILRISWKGHTRNEEVFFQADTKRKLMKTMKKQQQQFLGHCTRRTEWRR